MTNGEKMLDDLERGAGIGACLSGNPDYVRATMLAAKANIEKLREYARHKIGCAALANPGMKCDCGLAKLIGPTDVSSK